jgi:hypothetical protein
MQKILSILICLCCILFFSCKEDTPIGPPQSLDPDYILPQGNASQAANDRIQQIYDTYRSYILYEFTAKDLTWNIASGSSNSQIISMAKTDPEYAEDMVNLLDEYWLRFIPDNLLKGKWLPYRVFMVDTIKRPRFLNAYSPDQRNEIFYSYLVTGMSLAFSGVNADLRTLDAAGKKSFKNKLQFIVWKYYFDKGFVDLTDMPERFDELVNYTSLVTAMNALSRGFIPQLTVTPSATFSLTAPVVFPSGISSTGWYTSATSRTKDNDVFAYLTQITQKTEAELQPLINTNAIIREKYEIIQTYFLNKYGIDIQAIGNANADIR